MTATMSTGPHYWGPSVESPFQVPSRVVIDKLKNLLTSDPDAEEVDLESVGVEEAMADLEDQSVEAV